jgi:hypothetical protein
MMTSLSLKIDLTTTPITGTLEDDHGHKQEFVGWLGLSDALLRIGADQTQERAIGVHRDGPQA